MRTEIPRPKKPSHLERWALSHLGLSWPKPLLNNHLGKLKVVHCIRHRALRDGVSISPCPLSLVLAVGQGFGQGPFLKNLGLGARPFSAPPWPMLWAPPHPKPTKTNEKSMIRALRLLGTSPERYRTAQDHLKGPKPPDCCSSPQDCCSGP